MTSEMIVFETEKAWAKMAHIFNQSWNTLLALKEHVGAEKKWELLAPTEFVGAPKEKKAVGAEKIVGADSFQNCSAPTAFWNFFGAGNVSWAKVEECVNAFKLEKLPKELNAAVDVIFEQFTDPINFYANKDQW